MDSRLLGNDGGGKGFLHTGRNDKGRIPDYSGMTKRGDWIPLFKGMTVSPLVIPVFSIVAPVFLSSSTYFPLVIPAFSLVIPAEAGIQKTNKDG